MMEVVDRYDVDGINLDYVRTKGVCKTLVCRIHYSHQTNRDLLQNAENMWKNKEAGDSLAKWNAEAITRMLRVICAGQISGGECGSRMLRVSFAIRPSKF